MAYLDSALDQPNQTTAALSRAASGGGAPSPAAPPQASPADQLMKSVQQSQQRQQAILAAEQREKGPLIQSAIQEAQQPGPPVPKLAREAAPPKSNMQQEMQDWLMPMVALSAIAGAFSRQHATTALNAFSAGVQGLKEGNLLKYDQSVKEWKAANEQLLDSNKSAMDEYNAAWNNKKLNIDQKMSQIQLVAAKYQDQLTYEAAAQKNFTMVAQLLQKQEDLSSKLELQYQKLKAQSEASEAKLKLMQERQQMGQLDPSTIDYMARQYLAGDKSVFQNIGRGAQSANNIAALRQRIQEIATEQGIPPEQMAAKLAEYNAVTAGMRASGTREANIGMAVNEANNMIPLALQASENSDRGGLATWNAIEQRWQVEKGDPNYAKFVAATNSLINIYSRAVSGGTATVSGNEHARQMLSPQMPKEAYRAAVEQMQLEMQAALKSPQQVRQQLKDSMSPQKPEAAAPPVGGGAAQAPPPPAAADSNIIRYDAKGNRITQ